MSQNYSYFFAFFWGLAVFFSFLGYGRAICAVAGWKNKEIEGWGMQSALGVAVVIGIGGILLLFSLALRPVLGALVFVGTLVAAGFLISDLTRKSFRLEPAALKQDFALWIIAIILYAASVSWTGSIDATDDFQGYLTMPERIAQTGTLREPFGLRRTYTLGGHVFLKSLVQCVTSERTGHLLDMGICKLILLGLLLGMTRELRATAPVLRFCFIALALLFPVPRINTNSSLTGVCLLLPAFLLLNGYFKEANKKLAFQIGLLIAASITMRSLYIGPLGAACGIFAAWTWADSRTWKTFVCQFKLSAGPWVVACIVLIPWMTLSLLDCRTPLAPFLGGNINPAFANTGSKEGFWMDSATAFSFLFRPEVLSLLALAALPLAFKTGRFLKAASIACVLCVFYIALKGGACLTRDVYRFSFPILFGQAIFSFGLLAGCFKALTDKTNSGNAVSMMQSAVILLVSFMAIINIPTGLSAFSESIASLYQQIAKPGPFLPPNYREEYLALQKLAPQGAAILTAVDAPYLLDYARNRIMNADVIGGTSPPPGMPLFKGPQELKRYLQKQGINYILAVDWEKGLVFYNRKVEKETKREWFVNEVQIPNTLDFMDSVDWLDKNEKAVARGPNCRLIQLSPF